MNQAVLRNDNSVVGHIRSLRSGEDVLKEATQGDEVAIAISNVTVGRQISEGEYCRNGRRAVLTIREAGAKLDIEEDIISEMQKIKRKDQPFGGDKCKWKYKLYQIRSGKINPYQDRAIYL